MDNVSTGEAHEGSNHHHHQSSRKAAPKREPSAALGAPPQPSEGAEEGGRHLDEGPVTQRGAPPALSTLSQSIVDNSHGKGVQKRGIKLSRPMPPPQWNGWISLKGILLILNPSVLRVQGTCTVQADMHTPVKEV